MSIWPLLTWFDDAHWPNLPVALQWKVKKKTQHTHNRTNSISTCRNLQRGRERRRREWRHHSSDAYIYTRVFVSALCRSKVWSGWCPCTTTIWTAFWLMRWVSAKPSKPLLSSRTWWSTRDWTAPSSSSSRCRECCSSASASSSNVLWKEEKKTQEEGKKKQS